MIPPTRSKLRTGGTGIPCRRISSVVRERGGEARAQQGLDLLGDYNLGGQYPRSLCDNLTVVVTLLTRTLGFEL